jgi:CheY-like chemotaxis protein
VRKLSVLPLLYDAVVMDIRMPVMDGFTAMRICRTELMLTIPIIALSAETGERCRQEVCMYICMYGWIYVCMYE